MITITLQFKTLDSARAALAAVTLDDAEAVAFAETAPGPKSIRAANPAPAAQAPAATSPATAPEPAAPVETAPTQESPTTPPAAAPSAVEYPVLQKAVFALAGKSREAAAAVAASFGVKTFKELDASRWAEALAAVNAKLAEV